MKRQQHSHITPPRKRACIRSPVSRCVNAFMKQSRLVTVTQALSTTNVTQLVEHVLLQREDLSGLEGCDLARESIVSSLTDGDQPLLPADHWFPVDFLARVSHYEALSRLALAIPEIGLMEECEICIDGDIHACRRCLLEEPMCGRCMCDLCGSQLLWNHLDNDIAPCPCRYGDVHTEKRRVNI